MRSMEDSKMRKLKYLTFVLIIFSIFGCSINKQLTSNLSQYEQSLNYVYDSDIVKEKKSVAVALDSVYIKQSVMSDSVLVKKESMVVVPFILINIIGYNYSCELGEYAIEEDIPIFFQDSIEQEVYRSGAFLLNPVDSLLNKIEHNYVLEIEVDSLRVKGGYNYLKSSIILPFLFSFSSYEKAGPAKAECRLKYTLRKDNIVELQNEIYVSGITEFLKKSGEINSQQLQEKYAVAMAEALSNSINKSISQLVSEIDDFISFHEPLPPARNRGGGRDKQGRRANQPGSFGQGTVVHF